MDPQELSAQELVQLCVNQNQQAAWEEFVRRYQPPIACAVRKSARHWVTPTPALVDELVQDTYLKLFANDFRALREFDFQHENAVFGFLKTVASRVVIDHFRGEWNHKRGGGQETINLDDVATFVPSSRSSAQKVDREIIIHEVDKILKSQASEPNFVRDYCIFWLYYRHGFTSKAISELPGVGLTVKGVESTLLRLTRFVRSRMGRGAWG
jgi:RNA polymerase sigma-70 factor, ECF subfamily